MVVFLLLLLFAGILVGVPILISMCLAAVASLFLFTNLPPNIIVSRMFAGLDKFAIMAMPFYIYAADLMGAGGLSRRIMDLAVTLLGNIRGGLAAATELACMFFGALSGSSPATVVAIGSLSYPELIRSGYGKRFATGLLCSCGSVAILIPPSITMIVYASVTGTSVGALFMGGILPGIVFGLFIIGYCIWYAYTQMEAPQERYNNRRLVTGKAAREALWALGVPAIILGGIYLGVFTPTEAGGVSAVYAIIVGMFVYKELTLRKLVQTTVKSAITMGQVMLLTAAASAVSWLLTMGQAAQILANVGQFFSTSPVAFLMFVNIVLLILGMFMDPTPINLIISPLLLPIAVRLGIHPIHLGIVLTANLAIGMFTPPFGLNLFVVPTVTGENISNTISAVIPFVIICILALLVITYVPAITLWIPRLVYGHV
ncbi:MAG TPA: TRAP transporter large permease subunit [Clostridia bacterium]|nr:TRAP transporter large permease subunit [Clostridia bacterium]